MGDIKRVGRGRRLHDGAACLALLGGVMAARCAYAAGAPVCATAQIEIRQSLALERQAFDARLGISNGLAHTSLSAIGITLNIADADGAAVRFSADPDDTNALFFVGSLSLSRIEDVSGSGTVEPLTAADVRWRLIPAPGAGGDTCAGVRYSVSATLAYRIGERDFETAVTPAVIRVLPMPELSLDYFLPGQVYGDDALTPDAVEPSVPFAVGLRVRNVGAGLASRLTLNSGQPEIVANEMGLLASFALQQCEVNGLPRPLSLNAEFGTLADGACAVARWTMTSALSGTFTNFQATLSHADELGGELTSLIRPDRVAAHLLRRDVLVDTPGRDRLPDFLATDGWVYESGGTQAPVADLSAHALLSGSIGVHTLTLEAPPAGFFRVCLPNPESTNWVLRAIVRSDGKLIRGENAWISRTRAADYTWSAWFNLFDGDPSNCTYRVEYAVAAAPNGAPVLAPIGSRSALAERALSFLVCASDPDGAVPLLTTGALPAGVEFSDLGDGTGRFTWLPTLEQTGTYRIRFTACDGELAASETVAFLITAEGPAAPLPFTVIRFR